MQTTSFTAINLSLSPTLGPDEVWAAYRAECASHEQRLQATAATRDGMLGVFEGMDAKELTVKGVLFNLVSQMPDLTEEVIKTCCDANPESFKYLPAHGLRKNAMVVRVMEKSENEKSAGSTSVPQEKVEAVVKAITEEPNRGAIYYKAKFGFDKAQWQTVIDLALKSGRVIKSGERGNTVYFPIAA